jgi:cation-transporting ATPase E
VAVSVLAQAARPLNPIRIGLVAAMIAAFTLVLYVPAASEFFALSLGPERYGVVAVGMGALGAVLVWIAGSITDRWRRA